MTGELEDIEEGCARFGLSRVMKIQFEFFWIAMLCSIMIGYQHFRGPCCLHHQGGLLKCWYPTTTLHGITTHKITTWRLPMRKGSWF